MVLVTDAHTIHTSPDDNRAATLLGTPFTSPDPVIRAAVDAASVPALLMSTVHMTGDLQILDELPSPYMLIAMDLQGGMSEDDKQVVRDRAFDVIRDYRDRGCPAPFVPDSDQLRHMLGVVTGGSMTDEFLEYVSADLRVTDSDQDGPVLRSSEDRRSDLPVVVIGCGEAGILAGIRLRRAGFPVTIIERQSGPGGTWQANRYPGCRVDIPNFYYSYSFETSDHWSQWYSTQPEILTYLRSVFDRHGLSAHTRFGTEVTGAEWDSPSGTWEVRVRDADGTEENISARALICAVGQFSNPITPDVPGASTFEGRICHTAAWPDDIDLTGRRIAVIGAGASGFQLVPAIAEQAEHVDVYQRTPQWMAPNVMYHQSISEAANWSVRHLPFYSRWLRFVQWWPITDAAEDRVIVDPEWDRSGLSVSEQNHAIRDLFISWMRAFTEDEELLTKLTPQYPPMGKRTLQDDGTWITTLQRDDVDLIVDGIAEITSDGIVDADGHFRPADVLVWATGFDVNHHLGPIDVRGREGLALNDIWDEAAYAYLGITVPGFPNFYCMFGPGTNAVNGSSIIYNSECQMRYILSCLDMVAASDATAAEPRTEVCDDYLRRSRERLKTMVYTHPAVSSYYKNSAGDVPTLMGFRIVDYWKWTRQADPGDYAMIHSPKDS